MLALSTTALLVVLVTTALTSALSGVLGMGGGLILMGVLTLVLPVSAAMVVHGLAQLTANGARAVLHRRQIAWRLLPPYLGGALAGLALFAALNIVTQDWIVHLGLGLLPFAARLLPRLQSDARLSIERPAAAPLCGLFVTGTQLLAGASGPVLDVFFLNTRLNRHQIVATKALTQSFGHLTKLGYYLTLLPRTDGDAVSATDGLLILATVLVAIGGTIAGGRLLDRLSDAKFQVISRRVVMAIGSIYLVRGLWGAFS